MKAAINRTVQRVVVGPFRRALAPVVANVLDKHVERQVADDFAVADQSALGTSMVDLTDLVLARVLRTLAMSGAALGNPRHRREDLLTQFLPTSTKPTVRGQAGETYHRKSRPIYLPLALGRARGFHGKANIENCHGEYNQTNGVDKKNLAAKKLATSAR